MKHILRMMVLLAACRCSVVQAQTFTPVSVTGFNNDIVAESGTSSYAATTCVLDLSNYVLYSAAFAAANSILGGMVNNGNINAGTGIYQLASYAAGNGLCLSALGHMPNTSASGVLTLSTPASFSKISLLVFSTEGSSTLGIELKFTDGTTVNAGNNTVADWFLGNSAVYSGFGRVTRKTAGPHIPDGLSANPRFYPLDISIACADQTKLLQSVTVNYVSGSGSNARGVVMAVSGIAYTPLLVSSFITAASCGGANGSIKLSTTGGTPPFNYLWNTTPAQKYSTALNLAAGNYTCTITDVNGCASTWQGTVDKKSGVALSATASSPDVCAGSPVTLTATSTGGTATGYTWNPGNETGPAVTVTPAQTTTYTVTAQDAFGCEVTASVPVTVKPLPVAGFTVVPDTVCWPAEQQVQFTGGAGAAAIYNWNYFAGAAIKSGTGAGPYSIQFANPGDYELQLQVTENGCTSAVALREVKVAGPLQAPVIKIVTATTNSITFLWLPVAGAAGYEVKINGVPYASGTQTMYTVTGLKPLQTIRIEVTAWGVLSCQKSSVALASGKTVSDEIFIPNSFTPNADGMNDSFRPYGHAIASMEMKIFNQWGELIAESRDIAAGWDGIHKGKQQPMGVYSYVIRLLLTDGTELIRKGAVHLIR